jgi:VWFA-related protein
LVLAKVSNERQPMAVNRQENESGANINGLTSERGGPMRRVMSALLTFAFAAFPGAVPAQITTDTAPPALGTFHVTTRSVILDVVVTDKNGKPVRGLTRDDFEILEDKVPQRIESFDAVSTGSAEPENQNQPQTILLVDQLNTRFTDFAYTRWSVDQLLKHGQGQLDQQTSLMVLNEQGLHVLAPPTRDVSLLAQAMKNLPPALPFMLERGGFYNEVDRILKSLTALDQIAQANAGALTRKNIVWISPGFPIFWRYSLDAATRANLFDSIRTLSDQLLKARIALYTVDPRGVVSKIGFSTNLEYQAFINEISSESDLSFSDLALQTLTANTGGLPFYGRNDVDHEIASAMADGDTYYTLSYTPENKDFEGEFRRIKVVVKGNSRLRARTRDGYFALPEPKAASEAEVNVQLRDALYSQLGYHGVQLPGSEIRLENGSAYLEVFLDPATVSWTPGPDGKMHASFDLAAASYSSNDEPMNAGKRFYELSAEPDTLEGKTKQLLRLQLQVPVRMPAHKVRVVVRDNASGHLGSIDIMRFPPVEKAQSVSPQLPARVAGP